MRENLWVRSRPQVEGEARSAKREVQSGSALRVPLGLPLLLLGVVGCGSSGSVSGKVFYKDQPLGGGTVLFVSPGKASVTAHIGPDGSYRIDKIPIGTVEIAVETKSAQATQVREGMMPPKGVNLPPDAQKSGIYGGQRSAGGKYVPIPANYADPEKSRLTYTVESGSQEYNIKLD